MYTVLLEKTITCLIDVLSKDNVTVVVMLYSRNYIDLPLMCITSYQKNSFDIVEVFQGSSLRCGRVR